MLAIDPGIGGALAYDVGEGAVTVNWSGLSDMHDKLVDLVSAMLLQAPIPTAYLEQVSSSPIMGKKACFTFGHNFGQWETVLYCLNVRSILVKPQTWQRGIPGLAGKTDKLRKRALKEHAARLFPHIRVTGANQDALLILNYAMEREKYDRTHG